MSSEVQVLEVWGDFACFSRPELKVERWSYPCPTPSTVRGIFDAIYVKPAEFRWQPTRIEVLSPPSYIALRRNEVKEKASVESIHRWMSGGEEPEPIWADGDRDLLGTDEKGRTQRQTMALRSVRYRLHADIRPWPGFGENRPAYVAQFRRRVEAGKCFHQPYLGAREFVAFFKAASIGDAQPIELDLDLGFMVYDVFDLSRPGASGDGPAISLYRAGVRGGVLEIPEYDTAEVLKPKGRGS